MTHSSWKPGNGPVRHELFVRGCQNGKRPEVIWNPLTASRPARDGRPIDGLRALAADLGARWHEMDNDDPGHAARGVRCRQPR